MNFKAWAFDEIDYFRCSNILDNGTYFEYQCLPQETILPSIFKWTDKIVFTLLREGKFLLTVLNYLSGEKVWEQEISHPIYSLSLARGLLVSIWSNNQLSNYQIVNLDQRKIESGVPANTVFFHNVQTPHHLDLLFGDRFYFADNRDSYAGEQKNAVKVGFLNIADKRIEFIHEFHESPTSPLSEIVEHNGLLYVRNADDELFIMEV
ncbi:hypothetical protein LVD17_27020 [Fulvivirga ulvae]|uniref:hypothetical protein n=1 Tax=Fulvivirga ulvae TaxID=2904245 RepID=UPI001F19258A|nr:hypothetical protein [Fulvivirga ulvae]UII31945.1 hypothetical protein LVD17_27020 [Fulvivirga ulvae]